jgi:hypothetical protein
MEKGRRRLRSLLSRRGPYLAVYCFALAVRVLVALAARNEVATGDWRRYYEPAAESFAVWSWPSFEFYGVTVRMADHPPLLPLLLAPVVGTGFISPLAEVLALAPLGALVAPIAMLVFGGRAPGGWAFAAGVLAALSPLVWAFQFQLNPEIVELPLLFLFFAVSRWTWERPGWRRAALLGAVIGVAALAKSELIALAVLSAPFSLAGGREGSYRRVLARVGVRGRVLAGRVTLGDSEPGELLSARVAVD